MYCTHCAKRIDETKLEAKSPSLSLAPEVGENTKIAYVCPRCGHLVHHDIDEEETKSLSRAAHAQIQRARNFFASGMGNVSVGIIALAISILFFFLAKKPSNQYQLVVNCAEFYVFLVLLIASVILLGVGGGLVFAGIARKKANERLLREINDRTFVQ
ncbi:MAG: hypothetical protein IJU64_01830 [Bacilli bacterium]|nr:hypothetical protein [Bacilli bacterium]